MQTRFIPVVGAIVATVALVAFWVLAPFVASLAMKVVAAILLVVAVAGVIAGLGAALRLANLRLPVAIYAVGAGSVCGGLLSFFLYTEPTTINIAGTAMIFAGLILANVSGALLAAQSRR